MKIEQTYVRVLSVYRMSRLKVTPLGLIYNRASPLIPLWRVYGIIIGLSDKCCIHGSWRSMMTLAHFLNHPLQFGNSRQSPFDR